MLMKWANWNQNFRDNTKITMIPTTMVIIDYNLYVKKQKICQPCKIACILLRDLSSNIN